MHVPFDQLSIHSKVWIYASQVPFTSEQIAIISKELDRFTDSWQAHGADLKASYEIKHNHFIVIGVDETHHTPSGCSIDKSVQVIKNIESQLNIDLMNRLVVYVLTNGVVNTYAAGKLSSAIQDGLLHVDSQVFDNTITSFSNYQNEWLKPAQETWLHRYFTLV
ncbi:hypothetical protein [Cytophaga aurantiaca]|uniref:hypothetical protein n=1 Tax=Cytophaga aurantiaca TaxID=29530 RepID=UPI00037DCC5A|nr:hypothetical protein [Cytophaga aurantiaca]